MSVEQFRNGMRVRVTDHGGRSDMNGLTGKVVRIKSRADSAWIQSDTPLSDKQRRFSSSDERANHFDVYDNECEEIRADPTAPTEGATMKDSHGQTGQPAIPDDLKAAYADKTRLRANIGDYYTSDDTKLIISLIERVGRAEEILHGILQFSEQAGWGDPANLGHWLGAAQRWAKERV